jgi:hypothetical protein
MSTKAAHEQVAEFLHANPASTKASIGEGTGIKGIVLVNALRKLGNEGGLVEEGEGKEAIFSIQEQPAFEKTQVEPLKEEGGEGEGEEKEVVKNKGRDNSKFKFNGQEYGKGPLVRAVIAQHVADNPKITYKQLKEVFPDELLKRFGIFQDEDNARLLSGARDRYFFKPEQLITLNDKTIAVCNQFTSENIRPFLQAAKKAGYKIK